MYSTRIIERGVKERDAGLNPRPCCPDAVELGRLADHLAGLERHLAGLGLRAEAAAVTTDLDLLARVRGRLS